ncbi:MAG: DUF1232 domain-containing protein [Myxococcota bacterium]|nr:DUF1232 domain-containing protein [Myxococcota bacterium]
MNANPEPITIDLNPRSRRLWDRMRASLVPSRPSGQASGAADLALLLPDLTVLLTRLLRDPRVPLARKGVALAGIAYVLSPVDVLPSLLLGPVGFIDDLAVVAACLSGIVNRVHPDVVRSHWSGQGDALEAVERVSAWVEARMLKGLGALWGGLRRS